MLTWRSSTSWSGALGAATRTSPSRWACRRGRRRRAYSSFGSRGASGSRGGCIRHRHQRVDPGSLRRAARRRAHARGGHPRSGRECPRRPRRPDARRGSGLRAVPRSMSDTLRPRPSERPAGGPEGQPTLEICDRPPWSGRCPVIPGVLIDRARPGIQTVGPLPAVLRL